MASVLYDLPDVNVWLAVFDRKHQHHSRARVYWEQESASRVAFCGATLTGVLRLATAPKIMTERPFTPTEIWKTYEDYLSLPEAAFVSEPPGIVSQMMAWSRRRDFPIHGWTDCYLASVALLTGSRLVSFDSHFRRFDGLEFLHLKA